MQEHEWGNIIVLREEVKERKGLKVRVCGVIILMKSDAWWEWLRRFCRLVALGREGKDQSTWRSTSRDEVAHQLQRGHRNFTHHVAPVGCNKHIGGHVCQNLSYGIPESLPFIQFTLLPPSNLSFFFFFFSIYLHSYGKLLVCSSHISFTPPFSLLFHTPAHTTLMWI